MNEQENGELKNAVLLAGGVALVVFGAGLILAHPSTRRALTGGLTRFIPDLEEPMKAGIAGVLPDVERYLKMRAM